MNIGIDSIACYTPEHYLDLATLAKLYKKEPASYYDVLGQEKMSVPAPDEDCITIAANAAALALADRDRSAIKTVYFATESSIDQSKSAALYIHKLLNLARDCRVIELKQACYSGTFALRAAINEIKQNPAHQALIICSDVARYGLGTPGESTQGAGATAMVIAANPKILAIGDACGIATEDAMDFWRPNYRNEAFVDGQYSVRLYIKLLKEAYDQFCLNGGAKLNNLNYLCFHLPFSTIAEKAAAKLARHCGSKIEPQQIQAGLNYNKITGNCYTASLYQSLASLLDSLNGGDALKQVGFYSYGSGSSSEFFSGTVVANFDQYLKVTEHHVIFEQQRKELDYERYKLFYHFRLPEDGQDFQCPRVTSGKYRLAGIKNHKRIYER